MLIYSSFVQVLPSSWKARCGCPSLCSLPQLLLLLLLVMTAGNLVGLTLPHGLAVAVLLLLLLALLLLLLLLGVQQLTARWCIRS
jgi:hypothetical protein